MIVSNLLSKSSRLAHHLRPFHSSAAVVPMSQLNFFGGQVRMQRFATKMSISESMENMDDIFKQINKEMAEGEGPEPRIVQHKEDVVYIKNPSKDWKFNRVLNFTGSGVSAITISLQEQQAIALLLNKASNLLNS